MKYTIYKITNNLDGKIYIGKHQTTDINDSYMGSGILLKRAQKKYGIENFSKEILHVFESEAEMNAKEAELVNQEFCLREDTYNICFGGQGGFGYVNSIKTPEQRSASGRAGGFCNPTELTKKKMLEGSIKGGKLGYQKGLGKWLQTNKPVTAPGLAAMQSEEANLKRKKTMSGRVTVFDLETSKVVKFNNETRHEYDSNRSRYVGIRRAKNLGLI